MWPWGHAAVGYLLERSSRPFAAGETDYSALFVLLFASQLPDLVDKPLAWTFGVLPTGRTLFHSLLTACLVTGVVAVWCRRRGEESLVRPFAAGYAGGILGDAAPALLDGTLEGATFLFWPILASPEYGTRQSFAAHFAQFSLSGRVESQFALAALAGAVLFLTRGVDGLPGG